LRGWLLSERSKSIRKSDWMTSTGLWSSRTLHTLRRSLRPDNKDGQTILRYVYFDGTFSDKTVGVAVTDFVLTTRWRLEDLDYKKALISSSCQLETMCE
jgi:hypothetical protein